MLAVLARKKAYRSKSEWGARVPLVANGAGQAGFTASCARFYDWMADAPLVILSGLNMCTSRMFVGQF